VVDAAPLKGIRRTDAVDRHPPVGQLDPSVFRRHGVGQLLHVRLEQRQSYSSVATQSADKPEACLHDGKRVDLKSVN
jgi:hypothetical protein